MKSIFLKNDKYFQMKNKNYIDKKSEELLHDITERLDYILGRQEPEDMEEQLWQWLLIINGEASGPGQKDIKCIKLLYKRMMAMVDTGYQLQYLDKRTGVRVSDADEKQILNPAYALDDDKNAVYANTCMLHHFDHSLARMKFK